MSLVSRTKQTAQRAAFVLLLTTAAGSAFAQDTAPAPLKIAVLDMAGALFNSDKAKAVDEQFRAETAQDEQKVRALAQEATGLQEKLQKDAAVMSEAEQRKVNEQIQEIGVQYQFLVQKLQTQLQERRQAFQDTYAQNLIQAITAVVEEEQFDVVFRAEAALHYRTSYDITARVTEKLNQQP
jgi:outer membrane protein